MELKHGIHKFEGITGVNCYWTTSEEGVVVIDAANPKNEAKIISQLQAAGKSAEDVKFIILTHADIDHAGSAAALKRLTGAKLAVHEADAAQIRGEEPFKKGQGFPGTIYRVMMKFVQFQAAEPDILLKDGDEIAGFRVLHTPGHTKGSIMPCKPGRVIFTGDSVLSDGKGNPRGPMKAFTPDMDQAWASISRIADLEFEMMLPGHGSPIIEKADEKLRALLRKQFRDK